MSNKKDKENKKKLILVVIDGLGDGPVPLLRNKTPLEVSKKPNLNWFAKHGSCGIMYTVKEGIAPESDVAVLALLGYDPYKYSTGRGPLEAHGAGIKISEGDLVLRTNFATLKGKKVLERRAGRTLTTKEAKALSADINKHIRLGFPFSFIPTVQHRGLLIVRGSFSDNITNTDPGYEKWGTFGIARKIQKDEVLNAEPLDDDETTDLSADIVNSFVLQSHMLLQRHPLNEYRIKHGLLPADAILTRDAGIKVPELPKLREKWLAIVSMPLEIGIAKLAGMDVKTFEYPEQKIKKVYETLYLGLAAELELAKATIKKEWTKYDCFYVHIKETDVPGHDGLAAEKKKMIEYVDKKFISWLRDLDAVICVTADHSTPCTLKVHSADPVPVLIYGKKIPKGVKLSDWNEKSCRKGFKIKGTALLQLLRK